MQLSSASYNDEEESSFLSDNVLVPRCWSESFSYEEINAEIIDAVRTVIWSSQYLLKKLPNLKSHLLFTQYVVEYLLRNSTISKLQDAVVRGTKDGSVISEGQQKELFAQVVSACSAIATTKIDLDVPSALPNFDFGLVSSKNRRRLMEDQHILIPNLSLWPSFTLAEKRHSAELAHLSECALVAVLDGHGGQHASTYVARHLPDIVHRRLLANISGDLMSVMKESIAEVERMFCDRAARISHLRIGTTAVTALINFENGKGVVAWLGDSRADLFKFCKTDDSFSCNIVKLTTPLHRPDNEIERKRIEKRGGFVSGSADTISRINGQLGVSRSIGDVEYKRSGLVSSEPQFSSLQFHLPNDSANQCCSSHFELLLLSSDGLWDGLTSAEITSIMTESLKKGTYKTDPDWLNEIASQLSVKASEQADDNITCILIARPPFNRMSKLFPN